MRARFIGPDGVSFFEEIAARNFGDLWLQRIRPVDLDFVSYSHVAALRTVRETYTRELWHVPVGPLACPIADSHGPPGCRGELDVVYRYSGES